MLQAPALQVFAEMARMIERLADRDRNRGRLRQQHVSVQVFRRQRLLEPRDVELLIVTRAPDRLGDRETLIGVGHDVVAGAERLAHGGEPRHIFRDVRDGRS
jgi:hypothetical protein